MSTIRPKPLQKSGFATIQPLEKHEFQVYSNRLT